ncbi:FAD:protein FMN transferase [Massilia yuzhufengensis]|uniref:FAD:protein FMN transferase n=1 Tax=Massilia yuzhufengensis TaxID=1164594 RepID=A0A1I1WI63_9BURK|nr:FAD:protein FMN transferase [Massilia yuzhufengensis]SFD94671.1 thiamine biosynthesis lipoprotein [Massilia yuzhufengensis]
MRRRTLIAAGLGAMFGLPGMATAGMRLHRGAALAFGTTVSVAVRHADAGAAQRAIADALAAVGQVHRLMSIYDPASEVFRLNRDATLQRPDPRLLEVLRHARALSRLSGGAFDITVQPLWQAGRKAAERGRIPTREERECARTLVGWQDVEANGERAVLRRPGMRITLNGLAQGYAADLALRAVRSHGVQHALLDTGEFAPAGNAGERPWMLGVLDPRAAGGLAAAFAADGRCVATSGDYASPFTADLRHHHIVDPATGQSPPELASVTVLAPTALEADGLSTTFMVMGARRAHALAARLPGVDLLSIDKRGHAWRSQGFPELRA